LCHNAQSQSLFYAVNCFPCYPFIYSAMFFDTGHKQIVTFLSQYMASVRHGTWSQKHPPPPPHTHTHTEMLCYLQAATLLSAGVLVNPFFSFFKLLSVCCAQCSIVLCSVFFCCSHEDNHAKTRKICCICSEVHRIF
jgi:hypothetical protein